MKLTGEQMVLKLRDYKGSVATQWKTPRTAKQLVASIKKLVKFYFRCKESHLLTPDIVDALKTYAIKLDEYAFFVLVARRKTPELFSVLEEMKALVAEDLTAEVVEEKVRQHEPRVCSICRVPLVYPAYIVWRKGLEVVKQSAPIGIMCLNARKAKLQNLIAEIDVQIAERRSVMTAAAVPA
jgi:hypothetical protein